VIRAQEWAPGTPRNRRLRAVLGAILAAAIAIAWAWNFRTYTIGVDLEIPLRAAERWLAGQPPYLATAFSSGPGAGQPFLYPPYVLPFLAPLTLLPRWLVEVPWLGALLVTAIWTCRRLAIPHAWIPAVLLWPPFAEPLIGGNVQVLLFASFIAIYVRGRRPDDRTEDVLGAGQGDLPLGWRASLIWALKVGQVQPWLHVLRWRRRAAILGLVTVAAVALGTLPVVGVDAWRDWAQQLSLAPNPDWQYGGFSLARLLPGVGLVICAGATLGVLLVGRRSAAPAVGVLTVIGAPSLYAFGLLFLVPAMLRVRREVALVAAIGLASYLYVFQWAAIVLVAAVLWASRGSPALREPAGGDWLLGPRLPARAPLPSVYSPAP
jgi:hypothetical protein